MIRVGLILIKNVLKSLVKGVLIPLGLTTATSETNTVIEKKIYESLMAAQITSNKEVKDMMKVVKYLK